MPAVDVLDPQQVPAVDVGEPPQQAGRDVPAATPLCWRSMPLLGKWAERTDDIEVISLGHGKMHLLS